MVRSAAQGVTSAASMLPWTAPEVLRTPEYVTGKVRALEAHAAHRLLAAAGSSWLWPSVGLHTPEYVGKVSSPLERGP